LRPYQNNDTDELYQAVRESLAELMPWLDFAHKDYSIKETRTWLKTHPGAWKDGLAYDFAIFDTGDGSFLGGCGLNRIDNFNKRANLGYWVRTGRAGQGVAATATLLLARFAFKELSLKRIEIIIATENKRSLRVAEKVGALREGTLRNRITISDRVHDAVMFSLIPGDI